MRNPNNGARTVVLYGYVGSDYGKSDAQRQAEDFINDAAVEVDNRIRVNPELLAAGRSSSVPAAAGSPDAADAQAQANSSMPGVQSYVDQQNQAAQVQQYQQQNSMTSMSSMLPLIALLGILSMASGGGGFRPGPQWATRRTGIRRMATRHMAMCPTARIPDIRRRGCRRPPSPAPVMVMVRRAAV